MRTGRTTASWDGNGDSWTSVNPAGTFHLTTAEDTWTIRDLTQNPVGISSLNPPVPGIYGLFLGNQLVSVNRAGGRDSVVFDVRAQAVKHTFPIPNPNFTFRFPAASPDGTAIALGSLAPAHKNPSDAFNVAVFNVNGKAKTISIPRTAISDPSEQSIEGVGFFHDGKSVGLLVATHSTAKEPHKSFQILIVDIETEELTQKLHCGLINDDGELHRSLVE